MINKKKKNEKKRRRKKLKGSSPRAKRPALFFFSFSSSLLFMSKKDVPYEVRHFNFMIEEVVDSRDITYDQLADNFHLPINEVMRDVPFSLLSSLSSLSLCFPKSKTLHKLMMAALNFEKFDWNQEKWNFE